MALRFVFGLLGVLCLFASLALSIGVATQSLGSGGYLLLGIVLVALAFLGGAIRLFKIAASSGLN